MMLAARGHDGKVPRMQTTRWLVSAVFVGGLTLLGSGTAAAQDTCVPAEVDATDFFVDGELDLDAYLAAVEAANAACAAGEEADGGALPRTGSNTSDLIPIAVGLTVVGSAAVATSVARRRSANTTG